MKPFPMYILNKEEPEDPADTRNSPLFEFPGSGTKFTVGDLFCALQKFDMSFALLYAQNNFEKCINNPDSIEKFIKQAHKKAAKHLEMLHAVDVVAGEYRTGEAIIGGKPVAVKVDQVAAEMKKFCYELHALLIKVKNQTDAIDAGLYALFHFGRIHPFTNGNGRIARLLMNCIFIHCGSLCPIVFEGAAKEEYYKGFELALAGNHSRLNTLVNRLITFYNGLGKDELILLTEPLSSIFLDEEQIKIIIFNEKSSQSSLCDGKSRRKISASDAINELPVPVDESIVQIFFKKFLSNVQVQTIDENKESTKEDKKEEKKADASTPAKLSAVAIAAANNHTGIEMLNAGNFPEAEECFKKALAYWQTQVMQVKELQAVRFNLGSALLRRGKADDSVDKLKESEVHLREAFNLQSNGGNKAEKYEARLIDCQKEIQLKEISLLPPAKPSFA